MEKIKKLEVFLENSELYKEVIIQKVLSYHHSKKITVLLEDVPLSIVGDLEAANRNYNGFYFLNYLIEEL